MFWPICDRLQVACKTVGLECKRPTASDMQSSEPFCIDRWLLSNGKFLMDDVLKTMLENGADLPASGIYPPGWKMLFKIETRRKSDSYRKLLNRMIGI